MREHETRSNREFCLFVISFSYYIYIIDQVNGEEHLREKEGQWAYRLKTLVPNGLNDNDFFFVQNKRSRRT